MKQRTAWAWIVALLLCLTACGGVDGTQAGGQGAAASASPDEEEIQQLFARYTSALTGRHFDEMCSMNTRGFNDELVSEVAQMVDDRRRPTCERALRYVAVPAGDLPEATLTHIEVNDATAQGMVGPSTWRFARVDGAWKVAYAN